MADTRLSDLSAAGALSASDLFYVVQTPGSGGEKATGAQLLTLVGTTYVPLAGGTMTGALTIASGTLTASAPALNITQTWNNGAVAFTGLLINITNTASAGTSRLQSWKVGGTELAYVDVNGGIYAPTSIVNGQYFVLSGTAGFIAWGAGDLYIVRDAAATLAQRNGTTQQIFRLYNTYTDANNYERLTLTGVAGASVNITAETLGTGGDNLSVNVTPAGTGSVNLIGPVIAGASTLESVGLAYGGEYGVRVFSSGKIAWTAGSIAAGIDTALYRGAAGQVDVTNGTAATYRDLKLRNLLAGGGNGSYVQTPSMTVANLAAAATAGAGARAFVTDANATTFLSTVAGGGSNKVPVVSDGTNWLIG